jgi:hypothetical protein
MENMENQKNSFRSIFDNFTPEGAEDINNLDLSTKDPIPYASECISENLEERLAVEKTAHRFGVITFADWFSKYSSRVSSVGAVRLNMNGVNPNESIVVTIPNDQGKRYKDFDKRHLKIIENANIIPVIDADPIDMFVYNNGYQILYSIGGDTYLKGYSVRKKFIVNICKDVLDFMIPIGNFTVNRNDQECKFISYDLQEIIEEHIINNRLDLEKLAILYHQSKKFEFNDFKGLLKCLTARQGGIKDVQHQLEIDNAIEKLCLDGVAYET